MAFRLLLPGEKVAVEYEGGIFSEGKGGHSSVAGILRDIEKYTEAQLAGYIVVRTTPQSVANETAIRYVKRALKLRASRDTIPEEPQKVADVRRTLEGLIKRLDKD